MFKDYLAFKYLTLSVSDDDYSINTSCALSLMSVFYDYNWVDISRVVLFSSAILNIFCPELVEVQHFEGSWVSFRCYPSWHNSIYEL
jgi:hypothetical protein